MADGRVHPVLGLDEHYVVQSVTGKGYYALVNGQCSCPDALHRAGLTGGLCKHRLAAILYQEATAE